MNPLSLAQSVFKTIFGAVVGFFLGAVVWKLGGGLWVNLAAGVAVGVFAFLSGFLDFALGGLIALVVSALDEWFSTPIKNYGQSLALDLGDAMGGGWFADMMFSSLGCVTKLMVGLAIAVVILAFIKPGDFPPTKLLVGLGMFWGGLMGLLALLIGGWVGGPVGWVVMWGVIGGLAGFFTGLIPGSPL